jgi:hypothetical protein
VIHVLLWVPTGVGAVFAAWQFRGLRRANAELREAEAELRKAWDLTDDEEAWG